MPPVAGVGTSSNRITAARSKKGFNMVASPVAVAGNRALATD
jgi:hypothetical protein